MNVIFVCLLALLFTFILFGMVAAAFGLSRAAGILTLIGLAWVGFHVVGMMGHHSHSDREWIEIIQTHDRKLCRWEYHRGNPVVSVGKWHDCTDKELGA